MTRTLVLFLALNSMSYAQNWLAYIGTYTRGAGKGIYVARYVPETGTLTPIGLAAAAVSPSFLAAHPNGKWLYAVNESRRYNGIANSGSVSAFAIDKQTGSLARINVVPSRGADPCHLTVDRTGKWLFVANYSGGSVAVFPIGEDGALGDAAHVVEHTGAGKTDPLRQDAPHVHSVDVSLDNRLLYVSDLGADQLLVYAFDAASGALARRSVTHLKAGSGPRHLAFSRDRRYLYSLGELSATVTTFRHDPETGALEELQTVSTLPRGYRGPKSGGEIAVDPSGRFLYASNRGHNSIAVFNIDAEQGRLNPVGRTPVRGKMPRHLAVDPAGLHVVAANQDSGNLVVFQIDQDTGALTQAHPPLEVFEPACVVFVK